MRLLDQGQTKEFRRITDYVVNQCDSVYLSEEIRMDEWMDHLQFLSFSTVIQSNQDHKKLMIKGCVQQNPIFG